MSETLSQHQPASLDWGPFRRVHFYISDLIARDIEAFGIYVPERRVFEALHFGGSVSRHDGIPVAAICELLPESPAPQTVASTLDRMRTSGWVEPLEGKSSGPHAGRLWALTDVGREVRDQYKDIVELTLQEIYADATELELEALLKNGRAALDRQNQLLTPVADPSAPTDAPPRTDWGALRSVHFYINDQVLAHAKKMGVDVMERRLLDYLAFAHRREAEVLSSAAISAMVPGRPRIQTIETVLDRMAEWQWVDKAIHTPRGSKRSIAMWSLTEQGQSVRAAYKRWTENTTAVVYAAGDANDTTLVLSLAAKAEEHRNLRLLPIVEMELRQAEDTA